MRAAKPGRNSVAPDVRFHLALLAAANNMLLTPFGIMIEAALTNMFEFTSTHNPEPDMFIPKHEGILKAVARGNPKAARRAALSLLSDTDQTIAQFPVKAKKSEEGQDLGGPQALRISLPVPHIACGGGLELRDALCIKLTHDLARRAHYQGVVGKWLCAQV